MGGPLEAVTMKLYQFPFSPNSQKVVALAYELGVPLTLQTVNVFKGETRTPQILAKNPNGKVPILEDGEFVLWESNAILGYLAGVAGRADLAPTGVRERAAVERWLAWEGQHSGRRSRASSKGASARRCARRCSACARSRQAGRMRSPSIAKRTTGARTSSRFSSSRRATGRSTRSITCCRGARSARFCARDCRRASSSDTTGAVFSEGTER
nr:MAG: hypothetical protein DIU78_20975 [Pseudomonadota bacterium]